MLENNPADNVDNAPRITRLVKPRSKTPAAAFDKTRLLKPDVFTRLYEQCGGVNADLVRECNDVFGCWYSEDELAAYAEQLKTS